MLKLFLDPATLTLSRPQSAGELTVLPLLRPGTAEPGYLTLGEALARGLTRVTEVSEGGSVPQLLFINDAMRPVLLLDGEFQTFLEQLLDAATLRRPAVGLGEDLRIEAKEMVTAALVHEGKVVHLSAFVRDEVSAAMSIAESGC